MKTPKDFYCLDRLHGGENCLTQCELCAGPKDADERLAIITQKLVESLKRNYQLKQALLGILNDTASGCPMCDSGRLRNPQKQHWDDCPYLIARNVLGGALKSPA